MSRQIKRDEIVAATVCFQIEDGVPVKLGRLTLSTMFWTLMMPSERIFPIPKLGTNLAVFIETSDMLRPNDDDDLDLDNE